MANGSFAIISAVDAVATKSCDTGSNVWTTGTNRISWTDPADVLGNPNWRGAFIQRSSVASNMPGLLDLYNTTNKAPPIDTAWDTVFSWTRLGGVEPWPRDFSESVQHSTFYYYRGIFIAAPDGGSSLGTELDSGVMWIVQPFDLSICSTDSCGQVPQCPVRLVWDAPMFTVPFITGSHVGQSECGGSNGCFKIRVTWPYTPAPLSYDVYRSSVGPDSLALVANTSTSPLNVNNDWYDSDGSFHTMWYQFRALRPNSSVIASNIVQITY